MLQDYAGKDAPVVLTPNVVGGTLNKCHLPPAMKDSDEVTFTHRDVDEHYIWYASAHAWILRE